MTTTHFIPFPSLTTERLQLRQVTNFDASEIFHLRSDKEVMKYVERPLAQTIDDALELISRVENIRLNGEGVNWGITIKNDDTVVGTIGLWNIQQENFRAEIGYLLHTAHHRKGFMKEALSAVIEFGFNILDLHSIEAHVNPANEASRKLLESVGFVQEAYFRESIFHQGRFFDSVVYSLLRTN